MRSGIIPLQAKLYELHDSGQMSRPKGAYSEIAHKTDTIPVQLSLVERGGKGDKPKYKIEYIDSDRAPVINALDNRIALQPIQLGIDQYQDLCNYGPDALLTAQLIDRLDAGMRAVDETISKTIPSLVGGDIRIVNYLVSIDKFQTGLQAEILDGVDVRSLFRVGETYEMGALEDPVTGYMWGIKLIFDICERIWYVQIETNFSVCAI